MANPNAEADRRYEPCQACGGRSTLSYSTHRFQYGPEADGIELSAEVPVWICDDCGELIMGEEAEELIHNAVCAHFGRLTPSEIKGLRTSFGLGQEELARLTGYGTASIKRWEAGSQLQSESVDNHLRLIRSLGLANARKLVERPQMPTFKMPFDPAKWAEADIFQLRKPAAPLARQAA